MIESDLREYLLSKTDIAGLVEDRVYPLKLEQGTGFPALTFNLIYGMNYYSHDGPSDYGTDRIQIDCFSDTSQMQVQQLANAVRKALAGLVVNMGVTPEVASRVVTVMDISEPQTGLYRRMVETNLQHEEA